MARVTDTRPAYQRIAADLRAKIMDGRIRGKLPSIEKLKVENDGAANATIQQAVKLLRAEGLIGARQGWGIFVRERPPTPIRAKAYIEATGRTSYKILSVEPTEPPPDVAEALGANTELPILRKRLMLLDDEPIEYSLSYHPADVARAAGLDAEKRIPGGSAKALSNAGLAQRMMLDRITARPPTTEELEALELPPGVFVLRTFRVIRTDGDRVVEVCVLYKGVHMAELEYEQLVE